MSRHRQLIDSLVADLAPRRRAPRPGLIALAWLTAAALHVVAVTALFGPLRPDAFHQLANEPRFLLESLLGIAAIASVGVVAFYSAVPAALNRRWQQVALGLMGAWILNYVVGLQYPALEPSMLGKRDLCFLETLVYAIPPLAVALLLLRRLYPLQPLRSAMLAGLVAGMLPALYMQIACMYAPAHILQFHILPGMVVVPIATVWMLALGRRGAGAG
jgi:hypothetical protein